MRKRGVTSFITGDARHAASNGSDRSHATDYVPRRCTWVKWCVGATGAQTGSGSRGRVSGGGDVGDLLGRDALWIGRLRPEGDRVTPFWGVGSSAGSGRLPKQDAEGLDKAIRSLLH